MSQNLQNVVKFQKIQLDNLVDFEKCCKTHIYLQKSVPILSKTSSILPKFCQKLGRCLDRVGWEEGDPRETLGMGEWIVVTDTADKNKRYVAKGPLTSIQPLFRYVFE